MNHANNRPQIPLDEFNEVTEAVKSERVLGVRPGNFFTITYGGLLNVSFNDLQIGFYS